MEERIYIVGAHSRAQTLTVYLTCLRPEIIIEAYLYDNDEKNPSVIDKTPVIPLKGNTVLHTEYPVYIGTQGIYHKQIIKHLEQFGFRKIIPVTVELDLQLRNEYLKKYFISRGQEFIKIDRVNEPEKNKKAVIYVAMSVFDKPLKQDYELASYEKGIQAGAALTEERLDKTALTDNIGDNISNRNKQFCELTALYWIWKHAKEEIVGLAHYRRHFILPMDWSERMEQNNIDVILPIPLYVCPNIAENYKKRHNCKEWDYMMDFLKESDGQEYQEANAFFQRNLYSPCNMFIMRRNVLDELCTWLFPILFAVTEHCGQKEDNYLNRYPGFLSERLITFFFEKYRCRYKIVYSDKNFLF